MLIRVQSSGESEPIAFRWADDDGFDERLIRWSREQVNGSLHLVGRLSMQDGTQAALAGEMVGDRERIIEAFRISWAAMNPPPTQGQIDAHYAKLREEIE